MQSIMNSQRRLRCCFLGHARKLGTGQIYNNLTKIQHISVSVGLIPTHVPAYTGKTAQGYCRRRGEGAHPRAYGERCRMPSPPPNPSSSPPRIRGTRHRTAWRWCRRELTPAHTGNASLIGESSFWRRAHPRAYGEHENLSEYMTEEVSSPPRIRGTLVQSRGESRGKELTPAHTGNTLWFVKAPGLPRAHPRAYGEHSNKWQYIRPCWSSPPRIRGTHITTRHDA